MDQTGDSPEPGSKAESRPETRSPALSSAKVGDLPLQALSGTSEESPSSLSTVLDELEMCVELAGANRRFLLKLFVVTSTPGMAHMCLVMSAVFLALDAPFHCVVNEIETGPYSRGGKVNLTTAVTTDDHCSILNIDYKRMALLNYVDAMAYIASKRDEPNTEYVPCPEFHFDDPGRSIVSTFTLVCDRRVYLYQFEVTAFIGMAIGAPLVGCFSDQFGRRVVFIMCVVVFVLMFPLPGIVSEMWALLLSHFLCGISCTGMFFTGFTIFIEWVRGSKRTYMGLLFHIPLGLGLIWVAVLGYCVQNWRYFQMALAFPMVFLILNTFFLVESPRWMISQGLRNETWKVLQKIDPFLRPTEGDPTKPANKPEELSRTCLYYAKSLYTHSELRLRLLICISGWMFVVMLYYYLLLGSTTYGEGMMYGFVGLCGIMDILGYIVILAVMNGHALCISGFKPLFTLLLISCGFLVVALTLMPFSAKPVIFIMSIIVRMVVSAVLAIITIHTVQLFPTKGRNTAIGLCAMFSFMGGIVVPFLIMLNMHINILVAGLTYWAGAVICGGIVLFLPRCYGDSELSDTIGDINREVLNKIKVQWKNFKRCPSQ